MSTISPSARFRCATEEEMMEAGRTLGEQLAPGVILLLEGELGAGKTTLIKGIVEGFGAAPRQDVSSPTFALVHEYTQRSASRQRTPPAPLVYHLDLYRLDVEDELWATGFEDLLETVFEGLALMLVEWAEKFPRIWPPSAHRIVIRGADSVREVEYFVP